MALDQVTGTGGMLTKIKAATLATMSAFRSICSAQDGCSTRSCGGNQGWQLLLAQEKGLKTQKQWLAFYAKSHKSM